MVRGGGYDKGDQKVYAARRISAAQVRALSADCASEAEADLARHLGRDFGERVSGRERGLVIF